ncbi:hypothetical protein [Rhizobium sp. 1399]|uniref:hypothetical protein n=1 Tax=unclassified Rhizobium TaxID=2613769 RepID=UPI00286D0A46|nr:hypothetical protein [Rhizobium sp. 1399]
MQETVKARPITPEHLDDFRVAQMGFRLPHQRTIGLCRQSSGIDEGQNAELARRKMCGGMARFL